MKSRWVTVADELNLDPGYYWLWRQLPDGPAAWELVRFIRPGLWRACGSPHIIHPTRDVNASNAWFLGPQVEQPTRTPDPHRRDETF